MSSEYSFSVPRVQFMSAEYSLCPQSTVSVQFMSLEHRVQFIESRVHKEYSLCPCNVPRAQFMSLEYSLCPQRVQEYSLCPRVQFMSPVYVLRVQFMSSEYSLCSQSTVYVLRVCP